MKYYEVQLTKGWNTKRPFQCSWDYELIGDKLRKEFDTYLEDYKKDEGIIKGGSKQVLDAEVLASFMTMVKRINLVDDPASGGLKSVFILKPGQIKVIDERAKITLASRYEAKTVKRSDGQESESLGYMKFELFKDTSPEKVKEVPQGEDLVYLEGTDVGETEKKEITKRVKKEVKKEKKKQQDALKKFVCKICGKKFEKQNQLMGHMAYHSKMGETEKKPIKVPAIKPEK